MSTLNERIAECRNKSGKNQTEVAEMLGIKCSTYSQMERKGIVSADRLFKLAKIFGVTPCYLYDGTEPCRPQEPDSIMPQTEGEMTTLNSPQIPFFKNDVFVITKKEENLIKILRKLKGTEHYNQVIKYIEDLNRNKKK
ncbi:MAG: helix-turn-helix domain-containing protein [Clostridia bacterium]|nr:helix-turn-helix domain-containing protein [Clostridia bacterium]